MCGLTFFIISGYPFPVHNSVELSWPPKPSFLEDIVSLLLFKRHKRKQDIHVSFGIISIREGYNKLLLVKSKKKNGGSWYYCSLTMMELTFYSITMAYDVSIHSNNLWYRYKVSIHYNSFSHYKMGVMQGRWLIESHATNHWVRIRTLVS